MKAPAPVVALLKRCLNRDVNSRLQASATATATPP
jgi:hypothetical protein